MVGQSSDVSALVGLDGFVARPDARGGHPRVAAGGGDDRGPDQGARRAVPGRLATVAVASRCGDLLMADRPVVLAWAKRTWRCKEDGCCAIDSWSEEWDEIAPRAVLTERARAEMARRGPRRALRAHARDSGSPGTRRWTRCGRTISPAWIVSPLKRSEGDWLE